MEEPGTDAERDLTRGGPTPPASGPPPGYPPAGDPPTGDPPTGDPPAGYPFAREAVAGGGDADPDPDFEGEVVGERQGEDEDFERGAADPQRVRVRRAVAGAAGSVFGTTPIGGPPPHEPAAEEEFPDQDHPQIAAWIRQAALVAALWMGAQAGLAGMFMGLTLGCFLSGLLPGGGAVMLGLFICCTAVPVAIVAAFTTYSQTVETERQRVGLCRRCGYDLRGTVTTHCPECGTRTPLSASRSRGSDAWGDDED